MGLLLEQKGRRAQRDGSAWDCRPVGEGRAVTARTFPGWKRHQRQQGGRKEEVFSGVIFTLRQFHQAETREKGEERTPGEVKCMEKERPSLSESRKFCRECGEEAESGKELRTM